MTIDELKIVVKTTMSDVLSDFKKLETESNKAKQKAEEIKRAWGDLGRGMSIGVTLPIAGVGTAAVKMAMDVEKSRVAFGVMLGDMQKGGQMLEQIREMANKTPYETDDLSKAGKTMLQFGLSAEELLPTLSMLGDVAAGDGQMMQQLALVFGQVSNAGKLQGQDLMQLINAGFNPLKEISERTGESMSSLRDKMEKGQLTFDMVKDSFKHATSEGGLFHGMMEKMSETGAGKLSTAIDGVKTAATKLGETMLPTIKEILDGVTKFAEGFARLDGDTKRFLITAGLVAASIGPIVSGITGIVKTFGTLKTVVDGVTDAVKANPILLAGAAVFAGVIAAFEAIKANTPEERIKRTNEELKKFKETSDSLMASLKEKNSADTVTLEQGSKILELYPELASKVNVYKTSIAELVKLMEKLENSKEQSAKDSLQKIRDEQTLDFQKRLETQNKQLIAMQKRVEAHKKELLKNPGNNLAQDHLNSATLQLNSIQALVTKYNAELQRLRAETEDYKKSIKGTTTQDIIDGQTGKSTKSATTTKTISSSGSKPSEVSDFERAGKEYATVLAEINIRFREGMISEKEAFEQYRGAHESYRDSIVGLEAKEKVSHEKAVGIYKSTSEAISNLNERLIEQNSTTDQVIEQTELAIEKSIDYTDATWQSGVIEADLSANRVKWAKEAYDAEIEKAKAEKEAADRIIATWQNAGENIAKSLGKSIIDALSGAEVSFEDIFSSVGADLGNAVSSELKDTIGSAIGGSLGSIIGGLVGSLAGAAIQNILDGIGSLIDDMIPETDQERAQRELEETLKSLETQEEKLGHQIESLEKEMTELKKTADAQIKALEEAFGDKATVLEDQWKRGLISTEEFKNQLDQSRSEFKTSSDSINKPVDDKQKEIDSAQAQKDFLQAQSQKISQLASERAGYNDRPNILGIWLPKAYENDATQKGYDDRIKKARNAKTIDEVWAAKNGADFLTNGAQMMMVGEAGPEHVKVTPAPINRSRSSEQIVININGPTFGWDDMARKLEEVKAQLIARRVLQ